MMRNSRLLAAVTAALTPAPVSAHESAPLETAMLIFEQVLPSAPGKVLLSGALAGSAAPAIESAFNTPAVTRANPFVPITAEPPPTLAVDPPLAAPLRRGAAIIPYRTENFRILPIFGAGAVDVSPRTGHLHVTVDDLPWRWADTGDNGAVVVVGLPPGKHKVRIELATPEHRVLAGQSVTFTIPASGEPSP